MQICSNCGEENPDKFKLCGFCGTPFAVEAEERSVRKTVTIVFCDLKGSTSLGEKLDTESLREVLTTYFAEMRAALESHGGTVEKYIGDAVMAVFGLPKVHEDDAIRAVRAAADMQEALVRVNEKLEAGWGVRLENRTGVNTGEVVSGVGTGSQRLVTGDAVNVAARLEQAAGSGEILIGETTYRIVRDAVEVEEIEPLELKGKAERVAAFRLLSVSRTEVFTRRMDSPMVGREQELSTLLRLLAAAERDGVAQLASVIAPAGVGKSRLLAEFLSQSSERAQVIRGRCLSYGDGITFWPLAEAVRDAAGIVDEDNSGTARAKLDSLLPDDGGWIGDRLAAAMGLSSASYPVEETFAAAQAFFDHMARNRPLIVCIDDIHWAEDVFLDMLNHVLDLSKASVVLVCSARPELLEDHPTWTEERDRTTLLPLQPLTAEDSERVVRNLLGSAHMDPTIAARIGEAAQGNPLFVEQMLSMMIDDGVIRRQNGGWVSDQDLSAVPVPPNISALLASRLDRLTDSERSLVESASVVGQVFYPSALLALLTGEPPEPIEETIGSLVRRQLVAPTTSTFLDESAYRFVHILVRDSAYARLLKRSRAELHERFADWLEGASGIRVSEQEEIVGYHLEQAHASLAELGPLDEQGRTLGARAAVLLGRAGERAFARNDFHAAATLLARTAVLADGDQERSHLLLTSAEAWIEVGQFQEASEAIERAVETAERLGDELLAANAHVMDLHLRYTTAPDEGEAEVIHDVEETLPILAAAGDELGQAKAWRVLAYAHWAAGRYGAAETAALEVVSHARKAGDPILESRFRPALAFCALYGPTPVPKAIERCASILELVSDDRRAQALILCSLGHLEGMLGLFEESRGRFRTSRRMLEDLGAKLPAALTSIDSGPVEMLAGRPEAAEAELRADFEALERMNERNYISTTAAYLAEALFEQEKLDEAERYTVISQGIASEDDVSSQFLWRCVRGKVQAKRGEFQTAEKLVREGIDIIRTSDEPDSQGNALMDLAEVLIAAGRPEDAFEAIREAKALFDGKGNLVSSERAAQLMEEAPEPTG